MEFEAFVDFDFDSSFLFGNNVMLNDFDVVEITIQQLKEWCKIDTIPYKLIKTSVLLWEREKKFPCLDDIVNYYNRFPCACAMGMDNDLRKAMIRITLSKTGLEPSCEFTYLFNMYFYEHNAIPTYDTVINMVNRMENIFNSDYFDDKVNVGTKNLQHIKTHINDTDMEYDCSLCLDKISNGHKYYKLDPCNHFFHASDEECIGSTIINWLKDNHTCPNCRKEVTISIDESSSSSSSSSSS